MLQEYQKKVVADRRTPTGGSEGTPAVGMRYGKGWGNARRV